MCRGDGFRCAQPILRPILPVESADVARAALWTIHWLAVRSEAHTSELQSRPVISYAVFCLQKKKYLRQTYLNYIDDFVTQYRYFVQRLLADGSPVFFFNDTATTEIYTTVHTLSLHDALPI